ncbi:hypothetical protein [Novispirillum itersonii]|uniref:Uncharacterized protein n=1 Tax=Novispirillum itersonii TaxID=189 RepID=A0A7W9ZI60_NOVIT|nr:hypothetical protein [Novispirillum itersonii]MBB6211498.1 hypothetical protein [Novispirillum itersonii]
MTCKICGTPVTDAECCSEACRLKLDCARIVWDRDARKIGVNGYYDKRYREHLCTGNARGAKMILKEWNAVRDTLGERP